MNQATQQNWDWQKRYYNQFGQILRRNAAAILTIRESTPDEDMKQATDFVLEISGGGTVAVRVRRGGKFYGDITIRSVARGAKTEIHKLREGWAKYYLYCWTDTAGTIDKWVLFDLDKAREAGLFIQEWPYKPNGDGTGFIKIPILNLVSCGCVIDKQLPPAYNGPPQTGLPIAS